MWGALIGLAATAVSSAISNSASARKAKEAKDYLDMKEKRAENAYNYQRGMGEAEILNALSRGKDNLADQLGYISNVEGVLGGSGQKTASLAQQAIKGNVDATRSGMQLAHENSRSAYQQYQTTLNSIDEKRINTINKEQDNIAKAGENANKAFMGLAQSDLTAHLEKGKGLFETAFGKK